MGSNWLTSRQLAHRTTLENFQVHSTTTNWQLGGEQPEAIPTRFARDT